MQHRRPSLLCLLSGGAAALGLALLLLAPNTAAAPACSDLQTRQSKTPTRARPGRTLRLNYKVRNTGTTRDVALGLIVPPGVIVHKKSSSTYRSKHVTPTNSSVIDANLAKAFGVYWPTSTLLSRKSRKYSATFKVAKCAAMPNNLLFEARVMEIKDNAIVCNQDFAQQQVLVQIPKNYKPHTNTTKAGAVCPLSFQLTDIGYRCAEAIDTTPYIGANPTFEQCQEYCYGAYYYYSDIPPPYYFEYALSATGSTCGCVGANCTRIAAPGSFVLQTMPGAPIPPMPAPPVPGPYPLVIDETVSSMNGNPILPPAGVWNDAFDATPATTTQEILEIGDVAAVAGVTPPASFTANPPGYTSCFLQMTETGSSKAYSGIYFYPPDSAFNGMLFKDFVLGGMEGSYTFYLLAANTKAPSYKIYTFSPSTLQTLDQQPPIAAQTWMTYTFDEDYGDQSAWPTTQASTSSYGWWCSQDCLLGAGTTYLTKQSVYRSLKAFVNGLLAQPIDSPGYKAINDAVITGFQLTIGSGQADAISCTAEFKIATTSAPIYSWEWNFDPSP